jgi:hypothetical protein
MGTLEDTIPERQPTKATVTTTVKKANKGLCYMTESCETTYVFYHVIWGLVTGTESILVQSSTITVTNVTIPIHYRRTYVTTTVFVRSQTHEPRSIGWIKDVLLVGRRNFFPLSARMETS